MHGRSKRVLVLVFLFCFLEKRICLGRSRRKLQSEDLLQGRLRSNGKKLVTAAKGKQQEYLHSYRFLLLTQPLQCNPDFQCFLSTEMLDQKVPVLRALHTYLVHGFKPGHENHENPKGYSSPLHAANKRRSLPPPRSRLHSK